MRLDGAGGIDRLLLLDLVVAVQVGQPLVVVDARDLGDGRQAVEHLPAQFVRRGDEVVQQPQERLALACVGGNQVVQVNVSELADAVDAPHALLEANQ